MSAFSISLVFVGLCGTALLVFLSKSIYKAKKSDHEGAQTLATIATVFAAIIGAIAVFMVYILARQFFSPALHIDVHEESLIRDKSGAHLVQVINKGPEIAENSIAEVEFCYPTSDSTQAATISMTTTRLSWVNEEPCETANIYPHEHRAWFYIVREDRTDPEKIRAYWAHPETFTPESQHIRESYLIPEGQYKVKIRVSSEKGKPCFAEFYLKVSEKIVLIIPWSSYEEEGVSPAEESEEVSPSPTFSWSVVKGDSWEFQLWDREPSLGDKPLIQGHTSDPFYILRSELGLDRIYYWRYKVTTPHEGDWQGPFEFKVMDVLPPLPAPEL